MERIQTVQDLLARYGSNTTSFQVLEPGLEYWFSTVNDACVAYADTGRAWVAAGAPIAPHDRVTAVMHEFLAAARASDRRARFFALETEHRSDLLTSLCIGAQPIWDPRQWDDAVKSKRSLREQFRRARAKGVTIRTVPSQAVSREDSPTRLRIQALIDEWKATKAMAPMGFVVQIHPFSHCEERRYLTAEHEGNIIGLIVAVPIYARDGWFLEDVLRSPKAPNGTMELLFDHAIRMLGQEGSRHVTFGLAPLADVESRSLQRIRDHSRWLYDFGGLYAFKKKLMPTQWQKVFLSYPKGERGVAAICDTLRAFAEGSLTRFSLRTMRHRAPTVTGILALVLIPWTLALSLSPTWFPSPQVQWAWITLDACLLLGLWQLARSWKQGLATTLAALALADGLLGGLQLICFNLDQLSGCGEAAMIAIAIIAPLAASLFLWNARASRQNSSVVRSATPRVTG